MEPFGNLIRSKRKALRLRQWDVAAVCGVDQARVSLWENGYLVPSSPQLASLTELLGINPADT